MKLLHTIEEIQYFNKLQELVGELLQLAKKYNREELTSLANTYQLSINEELSKYNSMIGLKLFAPPSFLSKNKSYREGTIEGKFYFNRYSKSVRCNFRYTSQYGGGFDTHAILELKESI